MLFQCWSLVSDEDCTDTKLRFNFMFTENDYCFENEEDVAIIDENFVEIEPDAFNEDEDF